MSNLRSEIEYSQILQRLVDSLQKDIDSELIPVIYSVQQEYVQDSWGDNIKVVIDMLLAKWASEAFQKLAEKLAMRFVRTTLSVIDRQNKRDFGIDVLQNSPKVRATMQAAAIQNAQLIKSIPEQHLKNVSNTVFSNMRIGLLPREIEQSIKDAYGVTKNRARFIARDQSSKVNGELTKQRQIDAGYEYFKWNTSHDERVRDSHDKISKADVGYGPGIYRWDDLPTNESGQRVQPGSDFNCRCFSRPLRNSKIQLSKEKAA